MGYYRRIIRAINCYVRNIIIIFRIDSTFFYPQQDSIRVGDTLYFLSHTSIILKDTDNGQIVNYGNADNFGSAIGVIELTKPNIEIGAVDDFRWIILKGKVYTDSSVPAPDQVKQAIFAQDNNQYIISVAIIPLKTGLYSFSTDDLPDVVKNCDRAAISMKITNSDNHLHYLRDTYYGGGAVDDLSATHTYSFKVY